MIRLGQAFCALNECFSSNSLRGRGIMHGVKNGLFCVGGASVGLAVYAWQYAPSEIKLPTIAITTGAVALGILTCAGAAALCRYIPTREIQEQLARDLEKGQQQVKTLREEVSETRESIDREREALLSQRQETAALRNDVTQLAERITQETEKTHIETETLKKIADTVEQTTSQSRKRDPNVAAYVKNYLASHTTQ